MFREAAAEIQHQHRVSYGRLRGSHRIGSRLTPRTIDRVMSSGFEDAKRNVIETVDGLDEDDDFIFVANETVDGSGDELSIQSHVGSSDYNTAYANLVGMQMLLMHRYFEDYPLEQVARDCLGAARVMAEGGEIAEE